MSVQIGNSANTTHLEDATGSIVVFDSGKTLTGGGTASARFLTLGTKIGSGDQATGVKGGMLCFGAATAACFAGTTKLYGVTIQQTTGAVSWTPAAADNGSEAFNCIFQSTAAATAPFNFGANRISTFYNCDFSHTTTNQVLANLGAVSAERVTIGAATPTAFLSSSAANVAIKDVAMFGTPTLSDIRWAGSGAIFWALIRPQFSGNAAKFSFPGGQSTPNLASATIEYWFWNVKVVDYAGAGISGIPVKLTDNVGNVQVDTTTDAAGEITFTTAINASLDVANAVAVADWYIADAAVTLRHRSPFLVEVNTGGSANPGYPSRRYYHNWAGYSDVTLTAGTFADMRDVISLQDPSGASTNWTECSLA
jgi:hypothetical protein